MWKRTVIVVLSGWVLFAGYLWPHTRAHLINNWFVGAGLLVFGTVAYGRPLGALCDAGARRVAVRVFGAVRPLGIARTFWNDAMVAVFVFVLSLFGPRDPPGAAPRASG